jgi:hypothetical protein
VGEHSLTLTGRGQHADKLLSEAGLTPLVKGGPQDGATKAAERRKSIFQ